MLLRALLLPSKAKALNTEESAASSHQMLCAYEDNGMPWFLWDASGTNH